MVHPMPGKAGVVVSPISGRQGRWWHTLYQERMQKSPAQQAMDYGIIKKGRKRVRSEDWDELEAETGSRGGLRLLPLTWST